jgi:hypothetical protein
MFQFIGVNERCLFNTGACFFCSSRVKDAAAVQFTLASFTAFSERSVVMTQYNCSDVMKKKPVEFVDSRSDSFAAVQCRTRVILYINK